MEGTMTGATAGDGGSDTPVGDGDRRHRHIRSLVVRARIGDMGAFADLVRSYQRMAWGYAYARVGDFHLAEDVCQEAFVDAYLKLGDLRRPEAFAGWLRTVVRKHADRARRRRRDVLVATLDDEEASHGYGRPEALLEEAEALEQMHRMISSLPEAQRTAATLCYVDGCRIPEIADFLEVSEGTIRKRLYDARKAIARRYHAEDIMTVEKDMAKLLETHLSPRMVRRVLEEPSVVERKRERSPKTTQIGDARGMHKILEPQSAEDAVSYLNAYLEAVYQVVLAHEGFMDKVIGDEIMAFWGAPLPGGNHAEAACRAALAIQDKLVELSREFSEKGKPTVEAGIGINTGEAIIGSFGPKDHPSYTPMGSAVNLAARLEMESRRKGAPIIISEFTREQLGTGFETKELGEIETRLRKEPVKIYALVGAGS